MHSALGTHWRRAASRPTKSRWGAIRQGAGWRWPCWRIYAPTGLPRPACVFAFSPFADLTLSGPSITANAQREILLPVQRLQDLRARVLQGADPCDPRISPLFGQFEGAPPVLLQVARSEILLDDSRRMAEVLRAAGAEVSLQEWGNLPHVWQFFHGWLPEARVALTQAASFINSALPAPSSGDS
jgi:epsilon-lactone hydrolase